MPRSTSDYTSRDNVTPLDAEDVLYRAFYHACYNAEMELEYGEPERALNARLAADRIEAALTALVRVDELRGMSEQCQYLARKASRDAHGD